MSATANLDRALRKLNDAARLPYVPQPHLGRPVRAGWVDPAQVAPPLKIGFGARESFTRLTVARAVTAYLAEHPDLARYRPTIAATIVTQVARQLWDQARRWEDYSADQVRRKQATADRKAAASAAAQRALGAADR